MNGVRVRAVVAVSAVAIIAACARQAQVVQPAQPVAANVPRDRAPTPGPARIDPVAPVMMPVTPVVAAPFARDVVAHLADSAVAAPMWRNARWGLLIVDATTGDTIYAHDADKLFMPASNQKLLTSAVAMQLLGPDYRWRTPVLMKGEQKGAVFRGDIAIAGVGDPSVSDTMHNGNALDAFDVIADKLLARGIRRVTGQVLALGDAFVGPTSGYGWEFDDFDTVSGAAVDELMFNEGVLRIIVRGAAKAGKAPSVERHPTSAYPPIVNEATTRLATDTGKRVWVEYDTIASALHVRGTIAVGDSIRINTSYRHPNDAYRAAVRERLVARGIRVDDEAIRFKTPPTVDTLAILESPPLSEILPRLQKPSQNQIAELLFRTSGLVASGSGDADSARAVAARTLASLGVSAEHAAYRDGSGMSRHDYVTPRALVRILDVMHSAPWGDLYRRALPLAGVDGTISNRMKNTPAAGNASAKTGTLDKTRSLSGYVNTADGHLIIFSMMCNSFTVPTREVERVQDLLVTTIAGMRVSR